LITNDEIYVRLQQHLDRQAIGFPASKSRAELRILRHIFTPHEAEIATYLSYKHAPLDALYDRLRHLVASPDELAQVLAGILKKGGIEAKKENGRMLYANAPLVVGMYELQVDRLTPEFILDFKEYTSDVKFGLEFIGTALPQMRTIPVAKSIRPQHRVSTFDEVAALLQETDGPFVILDCICRKKKRMVGETCQVTDRRETCLGIGGLAHSVLESGIGREIDRDEAVAIITANQKEGLILQPSNSVQADFICSCCGCCCGMLSMHQSLPKPVDFWASNFYARVERTACNGCGICSRHCQVGAVDVPVKKQPARVDLNRCLGCGHCVAACPQEAIVLQKKSAEVKPPATREALYDILKANRKGPWGKAKLTGKLVLDMLCTRSTGLLK
jgi:ferredoxin